MKPDFLMTSFNREIYFKYVHGEGIPIVFLNGLSDSFDEWQKVTNLAEIHRPKLFVDLIGQGRALQKEFSSGQKYNYKITLEQQGQCLQELLTFLSIQKYSLVGFSYGGGLALWIAQAYPNQIQNLILFLPFLLRLDLAFPLSRLLHFQYNLVKKFTPSLMQSPFLFIEKSYQQFVHDYMHFRFADRIADLHYREAAVQISEGIMQFNVFQILEKLPQSKLHLISSDQDTLIPQSLMREFWLRLPQEKKVSWTRIIDGEHLLFDQSPAFCASLLMSILRAPETTQIFERKVSTHDFIAENHFQTA